MASNDSRFRSRPGGATAGGTARLGMSGGADDRAFTLIELLVVLAIIGFLAAISLPNIKGINRSNTLTSANRQLMDDLAFARQRAIGGRATVFMAFVPPLALAVPPAGLSKPQQDQVVLGQYTSYALLSTRRVGDQPGRGMTNHITPLKTLPKGVFIAAEKFDPLSPTRFPVGWFPFPTATNAPMLLPYLAFDHLGRLVVDNGGVLEPRRGDEVIVLARGSIFHDRDATGLAWAPADANENPPRNSIDNPNEIRIDWMTGRARVIRAEIAP